MHQPALAAEVEQPEEEDGRQRQPHIRSVQLVAELVGISARHLPGDLVAGPRFAHRSAHVVDNHLDPLGPVGVEVHLPRPGLRRRGRLELPVTPALGSDLRIGARNANGACLGEIVLGLGSTPSATCRGGPGAGSRAGGRRRLSLGLSGERHRERRRRQRQRARHPPERGAQRSSTPNVHSLLPRKLNGIAPATASACAGSSGAEATSTSRYRNTRFTPSARTLTVKKRIAWKPAWPPVARNVQWRFRRKLLETATQNEATAASRW